MADVGDEGRGEDVTSIVGSAPKVGFVLIDDFLPDEVIRRVKARLLSWLIACLVQRRTKPGKQLGPVPEL